MSTTSNRAVVVGVDGSPTAALAVAWAAEAARDHDATLRLVAAYRGRPVAERTPRPWNSWTPLSHRPVVSSPIWSSSR